MHYWVTFYLLYLKFDWKQLAEKRDACEHSLKWGLWIVTAEFSLCIWSFYTDGTVFCHNKKGIVHCKGKTGKK